MIGDWIQIDGIPRQVQAITKKKVGYHITPNECKMHYARLSDVMPIEMTTQIIHQLKDKCGFEEKIGLIKQPDYHWFNLRYTFIDGLWDIYIFPHKNDSAKVVIVNDNSEWQQLDCKYLHTLQHGIKLCGINFEIKL